mgnify:CR=1 FL=1
MKNSVLVRVEFDSLEQVTDAEEALFDCLLNVLGPKCAENFGIRGGIQFHRLDSVGDAEGLAWLRGLEKQASESTSLEIMESGVKFTYPWMRKTKAVPNPRDLEKAFYAVVGYAEKRVRFTVDEAAKVKQLE